MSRYATILILLISVCAAGAQWKMSTTAGGPPPPPPGITIFPTSATLLSGATQQFAATVVSLSPNTVTWTSSPASLVSSTGLFTAPAVSQPTNATVTATSTADPTKSATASVLVTLPGNEPWQGVLDPSRATNWSQYAGIPGGIPYYTIQCGQPVPPLGVTGVGAPRATEIAQGTKRNVAEVSASNTQNLSYIEAIHGGTTDPTTAPTWPTWSATATPQDRTDGTVTWRWHPTGNDTFNIIKAITDCGNEAAASSNPTAGRVVQLEEGNYRLAGGVIYFNSGLNSNPNQAPTQASVNYVVLRGMGADKTKVTVGGTGGRDWGCYGRLPVSCIGGSSNNGNSPVGSRVVTGGLQRGSTVLTVDNPAGIVPSDMNAYNSTPPGSVLFLDQRDDSVALCPVNPTTGLPNGNASGHCAGQYGLSMNGSTVTGRTTLKHGLTVGECVMISNVGGSPGARGNNTSYVLGRMATEAAGRANSTSYAQGARILAASRIWEAVTGGTSASAAPTFPTSAAIGTRQQDGGVTWEVIGGGGRTWKVVTAGTTGAVVPAWPIDPPLGTQFHDGSVIWEVVGTVGIGQYFSRNIINLTQCGPQKGWSTPQKGWFTVTAVPDEYTFEYTSPVTGIPPWGSSDWGTWRGALVTPETGGWIASAANGITEEWMDVGRQCNDPLISGFLNSDCEQGEIGQRNQVEVHRVVAVNGDHITIDPPIILGNWRLEKKPIVWWSGRMAIGDGIEELTLENNKSANTSLHGMLMMNAVRSWIKGVRSITGNRNAMWASHSLQIAFEDNYLWGSKGPGMQNYGFEVGTRATGILVQNNFCSHTVACFLGGASVGTVWAYGYQHDPPFGQSEGVLTQMQGGLQPHAAQAAVLLEGNNAAALNLDSTHGPSMGPVTAFRNRLRAQDIPTKLNNLRGYSALAFNRTQNIIGNVVGWGRGTDQTPWRDQNWIGLGLFQLGRNNTTVQVGNFSMNTLDLDSALWWGNWDVVTQGTRWCGNSTNTNWSTRCRGLTQVLFKSAPATNLTGGTNGRCWVVISNANGGAGGSGFFTLTGPQTIAVDTPLFITGKGSDWGTNPPTAAAAWSVQGNACTPNPSGSTMTIEATLGQYSEVPAITTTWANYNPVPDKGDTEAGQPPLPASFYLNQKPRFWRTAWGEPGWPAIGPDVDASAGSGGGDPALNATCPVDPLEPRKCDGRENMSYQTPAQICLINSPVDPAYQKTYQVQNATTAGSGGSLRVTITLTTPHALRGVSATLNADTVIISGMVPNGYNGMYILMAANQANGTFTYWRPTNPGAFNASESHGIVTSPNMKLFNARTCYPDDFPAQARRK